MFNGSVPYVAKINPLTMQVSQLKLTEGSTVNYTGGLLMHENGYVYAVSQSVLYQIDPATIQIVSTTAAFYTISLSADYGQVASSRYTVEQCIEEAKSETGLDEYEVRYWHSWHRHITLSMMAHAWLAAIRLKPPEKI